MTASQHSANLGKMGRSVGRAARLVFQHRLVPERPQRQREALVTKKPALGGFVEEAIFRGVVLRTLLPGGLVRANLLAAPIFATAHLAGLAVGADPAASALQLVYTWFFGFAAVAALTYARNLWPLVVVHGLVNFGSYLITGDFFNTCRPTVAEAVVVLILMALPAAFSLWLLRRASRAAERGARLPDVAGAERARLVKGGHV